MFHDLLDIALDPSKRGGSNTKLGAVTFNQIAIDPYCHDGGSKPNHILRSPNMVHFYFTLSLRAHEL
jgi:hypothetical protein